MSTTHSGPTTIPAGKVSQAGSRATLASTIDVVPDDELGISVVIPCLNELRTVGGCVAAAWEGIRATGLAGEVIVADNGSGDGSREAAAAAGARVVPVATRGYGAALEAGFLAAKGRLIVMGDADLSYDFKELPRLVDEQVRSGADMVLGDRLGGRIEAGAMPWSHRWIGNPLISFTIRRLFRVPLRDCYCGLRLLTRDAHRRLHLNASSMEFALEMIVQGALVGLRFAQVPITLHVDGRDRAPHLRTVRDGYSSFRFLFQHAPITAYGLPGLVVALAGLAALAREAWLELHGSVSPSTAAVGAALLVIGWQLGVFGIIARVFVAGFLSGQADSPLRRFFRFARLETAIVGSAAMLLAGLVLAFVDSARPAFLQLGLALVILAVGTFVGSFVVSLIGRAMPNQRFAQDSADADPDVAAAIPRAADTGQNEEHSLGTQEVMGNAAAYNAWLVDSLRGAWQGSSRVIDVGCSIGNVTHVIADRLAAGEDGGTTEVVGVEIIPEAARRFKERFARRSDLRVVCADFNRPTAELQALRDFDAAVSFNVLEHIEDDVAFLKAIAGRLKPGGRLGLLVPGGGDRLYGTLDALDRHFRRYTPGRLRMRLEAAGFEVVTIRPVNMLGALLWFLKGRVVRSRRFHPTEVATFERVVPLLRRLDAALGPPFGQSLAVVARLPAPRPDSR